MVFMQGIVFGSTCTEILTYVHIVPPYATYKEGAAAIKEITILYAKIAAIPGASLLFGLLTDSLLMPITTKLLQV